VSTVNAEGIEQVDPHHRDILRTVAQALKEIEFGAIAITIHQGEVVGIETSTKVKPTRPRKEGGLA
jgi:hypothetical protein